MATRSTQRPIDAVSRYRTPLSAVRAPLWLGSLATGWRPEGHVTCPRAVSGLRSRQVATLCCWQALQVRHVTDSAAAQNGEQIPLQQKTE